MKQRRETKTPQGKKGIIKPETYQINSTAAEAINPQSEERNTHTSLGNTVDALSCPNIILQVITDNRL